MDFWTLQKRKSSDGSPPVGSRKSPSRKSGDKVPEADGNLKMEVNVMT